MKTLIVTAHPDPESLTAGIAELVRVALEPGEVEIADLAAEGFDPRFGAADRHSYRVGGEFPDDVAAEHRRLDAADHLVLVFPVWWWSMPALLKGWVDRVFVNGWAFDVGGPDGDGGADGDGGMRRNLGGLTVHLLLVAGDDAGTYEKHGYEQALEAQVGHGIIDYVGARRGATAWVHDSERDDDAGRRLAVQAAVAEVARAVRTR
jgi:NAD(P)H dehydrogenase (quinone)